MPQQGWVLLLLWTADVMLFNRCLYKSLGSGGPHWSCVLRNVDPPRITLANFFHKPEQEAGTNSSYALVKRTCWGYNVIQIFGIRERRDLPMKLQLVMQKVRFEHDRRGHGRNSWGWQVTMYAGTLPCWLGCCSLIFRTTCGVDGTQNSPENAVCWQKYGLASDAGRCTSSLSLS